MKKIITFNVPTSWQSVSVCDYEKSGVPISVDLPCLACWKHSDSTIFVLDYSKYGNIIIDEIENALTDLNKTTKSVANNNLNSGNVLFHDKVMFDDQLAYIILTQASESKQFAQIFIKKQRLICFCVLCDSVSFSDFNNYISSCDLSLSQTLELAFESEY